MSDIDMRCIVCGTPSGTFHEPTGTLFDATGNYGSGVFDPIEPFIYGSAREVLVVVICDDCALTHRSRVVHQADSIAPRPAPTLRVWTRGADS